MNELATLLMPPDLAPGLVALLLATSFFTSLMTVTLGIGGGALLLAVLAVFLPPAALIPVHGVVQLGSNVGRAALFIRHVHWSIVPGFTLGAVIGVTVGGRIVVDLPPALVQAGVGLFIAFTVVARPPRWLTRWPAVTGVITSFLSMFFGATGPFIVSFAKALHLQRHGIVATAASLMMIQHLLKTVVFGMLGFAFLPWAGFIAGMILTGVLGTFTGRRVLNRISDDRFNRVLTIALLLIAARLVWSGLTAGL